MKSVICSVLTLALTASAFAAAIEIASPAGQNSAQAFLSSSKNGLLLCWLESIPNTDRTALRFARYQAGKWSKPRTIVDRSDFFVNWADFPSVVEDAKGVLFAHWLQKSGASTYAYDVRIAISRDAGSTWSKSFPLNRDGTKTEHGFVTLAPLMAGGVGATWLDGRNMPEGKEEGEMTIRYATINSRGTISSDVALDDRTCECCTTGMAMPSTGPVIAYRDRSADEVRDIAVVRRSSAGWTKPRLIHHDGWKIAGCPVNGPQVDAFGGNVAVAWFTAAEDRQHVYVAFSDDGGAKFAPPITVDDGWPAGRVDLVLLDPATAFVSWIEQTGDVAEVRGRVVTRNLSARPSLKIADSTAARGAGFPRMARVGHDVFVAWTDQTAKDKRVRLARIEF